MSRGARARPEGGAEGADPRYLQRGHFRYALNDDAMASDKLAEGIRAFAADAAKLDADRGAQVHRRDALRPHRSLGRAAAATSRRTAATSTCAMPSRATRSASRRFGFEAPEVFADLSKNLIDTATLHFLLDLARECGVEARRDAMLARRADQHHRRPRGAAHRAARAARDAGAGRCAPRCTRVLDAMLAYVDGCATPRPAASRAHRQHRHRRQRPRAADGGAGARRLRAPGADVALRLQRRRPRHRAGAAPR